MKVHEFIWPEDRIDHIARHGVTLEEVEEACFGTAFVQRAKSQGKNPVYYVLFPDGRRYPVTARPMTDKERRRYNQWKNR